MNIVLFQILRKNNKFQHFLYFLCIFIDLLLLNRTLLVFYLAYPFTSTTTFFSLSMLSSYMNFFPDTLSIISTSKQYRPFNMTYSHRYCDEKVELSKLTMIDMEDGINVEEYKIVDNKENGRVRKNTKNIYKLQGITFCLITVLV